MVKSLETFTAIAFESIKKIEVKKTFLKRTEKTIEVNVRFSVNQEECFLKWQHQVRVF